VHQGNFLAINKERVPIDALLLWWVCHSVRS
jgi:hypothetical protein